jgi:hypothetical protein
VSHCIGQLGEITRYDIAFKIFEYVDSQCFSYVTHSLRNVGIHFSKPTFSDRRAHNARVSGTVSMLAGVTRKKERKKSVLCIIPSLLTFSLRNQSTDRIYATI